MKSVIILAAVLSLVLAGVMQASPTVADVTHSEFQAVNAAGEQMYNKANKVSTE